MGCDNSDIGKLESHSCSWERVTHEFLYRWMVMRLLCRSEEDGVDARHGRKPIWLLLSLVVRPWCVSLLQIS
jgi:hypothetical protein